MSQRHLTKTLSCNFHNFVSWQSRDLTLVQTQLRFNRAVEFKNHQHVPTTDQEVLGGVLESESENSVSHCFRMAAFRQDTKLTQLACPNHSPHDQSYAHKQPPQSDDSNLLIPFWPYSALFPLSQLMPSWLLSSLPLWHVCLPVIGYTLHLTISHLYMFTCGGQEVQRCADGIMCFAQSNLNGFNLSQLDFFSIPSKRLLKFYSVK